MKKAGRKAIVENLIVMLNKNVFPKGVFDQASNIIECLVNSLVKGGEVESEGQTVSFSEVLEQFVGDEEEEKKEPPQPLDKITPQELFIINSTKSHINGVSAVECKNLSFLINKLLVAFALSAQALSVNADAFNGICITQGRTSKWSQVIKNSLLALLDKSQGLGKKSAESGEEERVSKMFNFLSNLMYGSTAITAQLKIEVNNEVHSIFSDKKSAEIQKFIDQSESQLITTLAGLSKSLSTVSSLLLTNLISLGEETKELETDLETTSASQVCEVLKLVQLIDLAHNISTRVEFAAYKKLKQKDDE